VHSARLPLHSVCFYSKIGNWTKLQLPPEMVMLIREQVARINVYLFCIDISRSFTIKASMNEAPMRSRYSTNPLLQTQNAQC
jgi:hypothetical protein